MRLIETPKNRDVPRISPARDILKLRRMFPGLLWHGSLRVSEPRPEAIPVYTSMLQEFPPNTLAPLIRTDIKVIYPELETIVIQRGMGEGRDRFYYGELKVLKITIDPSRPPRNGFSPAHLPHIHTNNLASLEKSLVDSYSSVINGIPIPEYAKGHPFYLLMLGGFVRRDPFKGGRRSLLDNWMIGEFLTRDIGFGRETGVYEYSDAEATIYRMRERVEAAARGGGHLDLLRKVLWSNDLSFEDKGRLYISLDHILYSDKRGDRKLFNSVVEAIESFSSNPVRLRRLIGNLWHVDSRQIVCGAPHEIYSDKIGPIVMDAVNEKNDIKMKKDPRELDPPFVPIKRSGKDEARATVGWREYIFGGNVSGRYARKLSSDYGGIFFALPNVSLSLKGSRLMFLFPLEPKAPRKRKSWFERIMITTKDLIGLEGGELYRRESFEKVNGLLLDEGKSLYLLSLQEQKDLIGIYDGDGETALIRHLLEMGLIERRLSE